MIELAVVGLNVKRYSLDDAAVSVVSASGVVDMSTVDGLAVQLEAALDAAQDGSVVLAIDLEGVTYFGSAGLNAVLLCHEQGAGRGIDVRVVATNPWVVRPIEVTGLDAVLRLYPTLSAALRSEDSGPRP